MTNCIGEYIWYVVGLSLINDDAYRIACPHTDGGNFEFNNNGPAISYNLLINDSARPFCVWTCGTECSTSIPIDKQ